MATESDNNNNNTNNNASSNNNDNNNQTRISSRLSSEIQQQDEKFNKKDETTLEHAIRNKIRNYFLKQIQKETSQVIAFQRFFQVDTIKGPQNKFYHYLFLFGATLGNEGMFASFLPFLFWHGDPNLARYSCLIWCIVYSIGQYLKEYFQLPRPNIVTTLENIYETEYGLPSTHAMGSFALSTTCCGFLLYFYEMTNFVKFILFFILIFWIVICCASRLYLGVHSPLDIYFGFILSIFLTIITHLWISPFMDIILLMDNLMVPIGMNLFLIGFLFFYKTSMKFHKVNTWRSSYGDTARIIGSYNGIFCGMWTLLHFFNPKYRNEMITGNFYKKFYLYNDFNSYLFIVITTIIGIIEILLAKEITKKFLLYLYKNYYLLENQKEKTDKELMTTRYDVEIPILFCSYSMIGFNATCVLPYLFGSIY
ncbi:hypothetical protein ABK040_016050 [Willaertia magna]